MQLHLVHARVPDTGLIDRIAHQAAALTWLAREAAAAGLLAAAEKVAPGATLASHRVGFGHTSARMVAIGDNAIEIDLVLDRARTGQARA